MPVVINGSTGISGADGSAGTPAVQGTDTNTGVFFPAADTIAFSEGGVESMRIDSAGNLGIGTTSPIAKLDVIGDINARLTTSSMVRMNLANSNRHWTVSNYGTQFSPNGSFVIADETAAVQRLIIDTSGNLQFNSGYGSAATAYGCRAWVCFNASSGTPSITASGNVSSITDVNVGDYGINFATAMPDTNYVFVAQPGGVTRSSNFFSSQYSSKATGSVTVTYVNASFNNSDPSSPVGVAFFR